MNSARAREDEGDATPLDEDFAAIDALTARTTRLLARQSTPRSDPDPGKPVSDRLSEWRVRLAATRDLSPVAAAG